MTAPPEPEGRIFLLSHMRACTSLAGHILGSHPQITGYYEMHLGYADAAALKKQLDVYRAGDAIKPNSRYLFDKLLHNDYILKPEQLGVADIKILVALAEPEHTIKSIVNLFAQKPDPDWYASPVGAARYYVARVRELAGFCRTTDWPCYYFDAELLQRAPQKLLSRLTEWLELDRPLSAHYAVFSQTGKARRGDTSARLRSGAIDPTCVDYSHIVIPEDALRAVRAAYLECRRRMIADAADSLLLDSLS